MDAQTQTTGDNIPNDIRTASDINRTVSGQVPATTEDEPPPPPYNSTVDPPPTYSSLFGASPDLSPPTVSIFELARNFLSKYGPTMGCAFCLFLCITAVVIGVVYRDCCPAEPLIASYLIVLGTIGSLPSITKLYAQIRKCGSSNSIDNIMVYRQECEAVVSAFLLIWFLFGNIIVYKTRPIHNVETSAHYCNAVLYIFAVWLTNVCYIVIMLSCCCLCSHYVCFE